MRFLQVDTISGAREKLLREVGDNFLKVETHRIHRERERASLYFYLLSMKFP